MADPIYTADTFIRKLGFSTRRKLARVLDPENEVSCDWREFARRLPRKPGSGELRYDIRDIQYMSHQQKTSGKSPTEAILNHIGTLNMTVGDIVEIFREMEHLEAIGVLLPDYHAVPIRNTDHLNEMVPEFAPGKIQDFSVREVAALTANFNKTPVTAGGRLIGQGGFGMVFLGFFKNGVKCAVKRLHKDCPEVDVFKSVNQLKTEVATLMSLQHENLVKIYGYCLDNFSIVLEYVSGGDLKQRLACEDNRPPLSWKSRVTIATAAANGIKFLHSRNYVHRDIKSANILLDGNSVPKIADFGVVRQLPTDKTSQYTELVYATRIYQAPETHVGKFSYKADTYSFGVVLLEIITGLKVLDQDREDTDIISLIEENVPTSDMILNFVDDKSYPYVERQVVTMFEIAKKCLIDKRKHRPDMDQVYQELAAICQ